VEQRKQGRGSHQHFTGSWARLNCENMPVIPAWLVRINLNDPRRISYLLVWKDARDGQIKEAVRLARYVDPHDSRAESNHVELKRPDGSTTILRVVWRMLPRNGGRALFLLCPYCDTPRRHVYGWEWDSFSGWSNRVRTISATVPIPFYTLGLCKASNYSFPILLGSLSPLLQELKSLLSFP
jgi:hypothetical protein